MSYSTVTGKVIATRRAGTSTMGNPSYWVTLDNGETYRTTANAGLAYEITNRNYRETAHRFGLTKRGYLDGHATPAAEG